MVRLPEDHGFTCRESAHKAAILTYHSIDDSGSVISVAPAKFREHMRQLRESNCKVVPLADLVSCIRQRRAFPSKTVAITFDDGFRNVYEAAFPVLQEFGFPATVFLVPGYSGSRNRWDEACAGIPSLPLLDWTQIREMGNSGIEFGAHTLTHPNLAQLPLEEAQRQITQSRKTIEAKLGRAVSLFAYPYGRRTEQVRSFVAERFRGTCSTLLDYATLDSDVSLLPRIEMHYFARNQLFSLLGTRPFSCYVKWRSMLRALRGNG